MSTEESNIKLKLLESSLKKFEPCILQIHGAV